MTAAPKPRTIADTIAIVRRSVLCVHGGTSGGTGWVVLGNGLVMTSHEAVGYQVTVQLELEGGRRCDGRVIWVDVARDLALILPAERLPMAPLVPRPDLPRLGEVAFSLSALPEQPVRVASGLVSAVDCRVGTLRCFEIDVAAGSRGGPVVDLDGRVIGVGGLELPRGSHRARAGEPARHLAIPIAAMQRALAAVDLPTNQFAERNPIYRCPSCNEPFSVETDRCLTCGSLLPHGWEADLDPRGPSLAAAARLVRELLEDVGASPLGARVGPRSYRCLAPGNDGAGIELELEIDEEGNSVSGRVPLLRIPTQNQEPFFRFLLSLNDQGAGSQRLGIEGETVYFSFVESAALVRPGEGAARLQEMLREGDRYKRALQESFEVPAAS